MARESAEVDWHFEQDDAISRALVAQDEAAARIEVFARLWAAADDFLLDRHLVNMLSVFGSDDRFTLIDVGCGTGELIRRLHELFPNAEFVGIDSNAPSIARAKEMRLVSAEFHLARFEQLDIEQQFDVVICSEVFEHVEDTSRLLQTLAGLTRDGGHLSFSTPSGWMYRSPRLSNIFRMVRYRRRFFDLYLHPESNWRSALAIHPAMQPSKMIRRLRAHGFELEYRQSSLWWMEERGLLYRLFTWLERKGARWSGPTFYSLYSILEHAMNVVPVLRVFESRMVVLMRRKRTGPDLRADRLGQ